MRRRHLFEFNDSVWTPAALRETVVESLSRTLDWGRILRGLVGPFRDFVERSGVHEVLDLCSGAGRPAAILAGELTRAGVTPPRFLLTDLQPHLEAWTAIRDEHPGLIDFIPEAVDATQIPEAIGHGRARVIINAFHHFQPELAGEILRRACERSPGVFLAEGFERGFRGFFPFAAAGIPALYLNPILAPRRRLQKALWTWVTPISLAVSVWDGLISTWRVYDERELRDMVKPLGDAFAWEYGTYRFKPFGLGYYFYGVRRIT